MEFSGKKAWNNIFAFVDVWRLCPNSGLYMLTMWVLQSITDVCLMNLWCASFYKLLLMSVLWLSGVEPTRYPTSELIRRRNAGEPLEDDEDKDALPRGKGNWLGQ
jgi:hypothetical protein